MKRPPGSGEVEQLGVNRFRARLPRSLRRKSLGIFTTHDEACRVLDATLTDFAEGNASIVADGVTLAAYGEKCLRQRKADDCGGVKEDGYRWSAHVGADPIGALAVESVRDIDLRAWRDRLQAKLVRRRYRKGGALVETGPAKPLSVQSVRNTLNLMRGVLRAAVETGVLASNPAREIGVTRRARRVVREPWTYLALHEQQAFASTDPSVHPLIDMLLVAMGTGLRKGELWCLELTDLVVEGDRPHVLVRFGSPGKLPKSGRVRTVPLFGIALAAAKRWLARLPAYCERNPKGLVFPTPRGTCRWQRQFREWKPILRSAGIGRPIRLHDLRHTCGSSLVAGWWGRRWSLLEVRDLLGHADVRTTQRYAHLAGTVIEDAAKGTGGGGLAGSIPSAPSCPTAPPNVSGSLASLRSTEPVVGSSNLPGRAADSDAAWGSRGAARGLVEAVASGADDRVPGLVVAVADAAEAVSAELLTLVDQVRDGGPHAIATALRLAELLLEADGAVWRKVGAAR